MRSVLLTVLAALLAWPVQGAEKTFDFGAFPPGQTPPGFRSTVTGKGQPGKWEVLLEDADSILKPVTDRAPNTSKRAVLAQLSEDLTNDHYPLLIAEDEVYGDFTLTTKFKIVRGIAEQMAGIAFRIQDEKNYYYVRASALGNSFRFYKFVDGVLSPPVSKDIQVKPGEWHEMKIEAKGNQLDFYFDGQQAFPTATDSTFTSGKIGFWTKSDSVSYFADTKIVYTPRDSLAVIMVREMMERYPRLRGLLIYMPDKNSSDVKVVASNRPEDLGKLGDKVEKDVIARDTMYYGKTKEAIVTLPLHDRNGEVVAAVRFELQSFPGQTDQNALARALPMLKDMEKRVQASKDLLN